VGEIVVMLGALVTAGAVLWWHSFWTDVAAFLGSKGGAPLECLYALSGECRTLSKIASFAGANAYEPTSFWVGLGLLVAGLVLALRSKGVRPTTPRHQSVGP
jgi:hypothetical protein